MASVAAVSLNWNMTRWVTLPCREGGSYAPRLRGLASMNKLPRERMATMANTATLFLAVSSVFIFAT